MFESQAYHLSFYKFEIVSWGKDEKEAGIGPLLKKNAKYHKMLILLKFCTYQYSVGWQL